MCSWAPARRTPSTCAASTASGHAASFQELWIEALEVEAIGERVLVRVRQRGRFRTSGIDVDVTYFQLWTFSGGRAVRFQVFEPGAETEARAAADR